MSRNRHGSLSRSPAQDRIRCYVRTSGNSSGARSADTARAKHHPPSTENVFLHTEAKAVRARRPDTIYPPSLVMEGGNQVVGSGNDRDPKRILITGAAGNMGTMLRPMLRRDDRVLRLADIVDLEPEPGEEFVNVDVLDAVATAKACQ